MRLQDNAGGDLAASDGSDELFKIRDLADIRKLIDQAAHMHRKPPAVHIIRFFAQQVKQLRVSQADEKIEAGIRIGHDEEQRRALVSDGIQRQLIVGGNLPQFVDVKDRKSRAAAHQNGFRRLAGNKLSRTF